MVKSIKKLKAHVTHCHSRWVNIARKRKTYVDAVWAGVEPARMRAPGRFGVLTVAESHVVGLLRNEEDDARQEYYLASQALNKVLITKAVQANDWAVIGEFLSDDDYAGEAQHRAHQLATWDAAGRPVDESDAYYAARHAVTYGYTTMYRVWISDALGFQYA